MQRDAPEQEPPDRDAGGGEQGLRREVQGADPQLPCQYERAGRTDGESCSGCNDFKTLES